MPTAELSDAVVRPDPNETQDLEHLREQIEVLLDGHKTAQLIGPNGERLDIPASAFHALQLVVRSMARGLTMTLVPHGQDLTTQEAADILHVSRQHLTKLLKNGIIPFHQVGSHRRVTIEDVLAYREQRASTRHEKIRELTRQSQELGGYD